MTRTVAIIGIGLLQNARAQSIIIEPVASKWSNAPVANVKATAEAGDISAAMYLGSYFSNVGKPSPDYTEALRWFRLAAQKGSPDAQNNVGLFYLYGLGVSRDLNEAIRWFRLAAEQKLIKGYRNLGAALILDQNFGEGAEWLDKAAWKDDVPSAYQLGLMYETGTLNGSLHKAVQYYAIAADHQFLPAVQRLVAIYLDEDNSSPKNYPALRKYLKQLIKVGDVDSSYYLGMILEAGKDIAPDLQEAAKYYQEAATHGHPEAANRMGELYRDGVAAPRDDEKAFRLFKIASSYMLDAQLNLAEMYATGRGTPTNIAEAVPLFWNVVKLCDCSPPKPLTFLTSFYNNGSGFDAPPEVNNEVIQHIYDSQYSMMNTPGESISRIGEHYFTGNRVPKDIGTALRFFSVASLRGAANAENRIGEMWKQGTGGKVDNNEAFLWFRRAAHQNFGPAQLNMARCYMAGEGVPRDEGTALIWLILSSRTGNEEATILRNESMKRLSSADLMKARRLADAFARRYAAANKN